MAKDLRILPGGGVSRGQAPSLALLAVQKIPSAIHANNVEHHMTLNREALITNRNRAKVRRNIAPLAC